MSYILYAGHPSEKLRAPGRRARPDDAGAKQADQRAGKASGIRFGGVFYDEYRGKDACIDYERRDHVDAEIIDDRVQRARILPQLAVAPVLVPEAAEGVRPVDRKSNAPREYRYYEQKSGRVPAA